MHCGSHGLQVSVSVDGTMETVSCGSHDPVEDDSNEHPPSIEEEDNGMVCECSIKAKLHISQQSQIP